VLGLVSRRGRELGGEAAELGRLAAEQETALRSLVASSPASSQVHSPSEGVTVDLAGLVRGMAGPSVSVATPADPVLMPGPVAAELAAAVRAALDNVAQHAGPGARAQVLVEDRRDGVRVTVRDDGVGLAPGRLVDAEAEGRLGVASSVVGRLRDLGGTADVTGRPGDGVEVVLELPLAAVGVRP
jgi:signal transduction histidine kinase